MAQAQVHIHYQQNTLFFDIDGQLMVKIWKKRREGTFVTFKKPGTTQSLTVPLQVFRSLLQAQDMFLLASDFIRGLVGVSPEEFARTLAHKFDCFGMRNRISSD